MRMVSIEESKSPRGPRRRMISYKLDDDNDNTSLHSAGSVLSLDSEVDDVKKPSEMVSKLLIYLLNRYPTNHVYLKIMVVLHFSYAVPPSQHCSSRGGESSWKHLYMDVYQVLQSRGKLCCFILHTFLLHPRRSK